MLLGGERDLMAFLLLVCGTVMYFAGITTVFGFLVSVSIWFFGLFCFRRMGKADPKLSKVWWRYRKYAEYYPARSRPWREY